MCLGIPGQVCKTFDADGLRMGEVAFGEIRQRVCLEHTRDAEVGDYVLVHVGFALQKIAPAEAERVFRFLRSLGELQDLREAEDADAEHET